MFGRRSSPSHQSHGHGIAGLLAHEIKRAEKRQWYLGMFVLGVPAEVPRGVSRFLPGRTLGYQHYRDYRRYVGVVHDSCDRDLVTMCATIEQVARQHNWTPFNVGVALWPMNGRSAEELLQWARFDAHRRTPVFTAAAPKLAPPAAVVAKPRQAVHGAAPPAGGAAQEASPPATPPLGRFLVQQGFITEAQLHQALEFQRFQHTSLGGLALQHGLLTERKVLDILFRQEEHGELFGEAALALGLLTEEQIRVLLHEQRMNLPPLGQVLQLLGFLDAADLACALDELCGAFHEKGRAPEDLAAEWSAMVGPRR